MTREEFDLELLLAHRYISKQTRYKRGLMAHHITALMPLLKQVRTDEQQRAAAERRIWAALDGRLS